MLCCCGFVVKRQNSSLVAGLSSLATHFSCNLLVAYRPCDLKECVYVYKMRGWFGHTGQDIALTDLSLEYLFHPRSIAVAGVSGDSDGFNAGLRYLRIIADAGFKGRLHGVSPTSGEVSGFKIYSSVRDVPGEVDYVISAIPARFTPQLMTDCVAKGVKAVHFFTAGFGEIEDAGGKMLEAEILSIARNKSIRIVGPNCLGLYCPETGLSFSPQFPKQSGDFALMAQSGGNSVNCVCEASSRGLYFSKVISFGNAIDLNECDFLEYLADDLKTSVIGVYLEGARDGARFARILREATKRKPVIVLKAGSTDAGVRAAASHTGSMAGRKDMWESMLKQTGAIRVHSIGEIVDVALVFLRMSPPGGRRTLLIGPGGGASVIAADDCARAGLTLPILPAGSREKLKQIMGGTETGGGFRNPVDLYRPDLLKQAVEAACNWDEFDVLLAHLPFELYGLMPDDTKDVIRRVFIQAVLDLRESPFRPHAVVLHASTADRSRQQAMELRAKLSQAGFAVFESIGHAASAINKAMAYYEWRQRAVAGDEGGYYDD